MGMALWVSTHDSTAWVKTRTYEEHKALFEGNEFIFGDSAYPVCALNLFCDA